MTTGETEAEAEGVPAGDAELAGLVLVVGFGVVADGDVVGTGEVEAADGVVTGMTTSVAAGGSGLISR